MQTALAALTTKRNGLMCFEVSDLHEVLFVALLFFFFPRVFPAASSH